jgi:hypothetical protein
MLLNNLMLSVPNELTIFIDGLDMMQGYAVLHTFFIHIMKDIMLARLKDNVTKWQSNYLFLNPVINPKFKITLPELGVTLSLMIQAEKYLCMRARIALSGKVPRLDPSTFSIYSIF